MMVVGIGLTAVLVNQTHQNANSLIYNLMDIFFLEILFFLEKPFSSDTFIKRVLQMCCTNFIWWRKLGNIRLSSAEYQAESPSERLMTPTPFICADFTGLCTAKRLSLKK